MPEPVTMAAIHVAKSKTGQKLIKIGCLAIAAIVIVPVFMVLALMSALLGAEEATADCGGGGGSASGPVSADQTANARIIIGVARGRNFPRSAWVIALAASLTEASLQNLDYGDADSVGLFQIRAMHGSLEERMDPVWESNWFFDHLMGVSGWEQMAPGDAAQAVEKSAYPDRYAANVAQANQFAAANADAPAIASPGRAVYGGGKGSGGSGDCARGNGSTAAIKAAADKLDAMNLPYIWGGGHSNPVPDNPAGLDCSSAVAWVLQHGGFNMSTGTSGEYMSLGEPADNSNHPTGVYIYAGSGHTFLTIDGRVFSSITPYSPTGGPHWRNWGVAGEWQTDMVVRHIPGT